MYHLFFYLLLFVAALVRVPLALIVIVLKNIITPLRKRVEFERKNLLDEHCRSFKKDGLFADYCFEVSSEGELEQVRPLIERFIAEQKRVEILFASPSVETKCQKIALQYPQNVRILRLPIASFFPVPFLFFQPLWFWVSAPRIIFCRYDFFPELLSFKFMGKKLFLLSAASKNPGWFKKECFALFNVIVASNAKELKIFKTMFPETASYSFDFRVPRIFDRIKSAPEVLGRAPELEGLLTYLSTFPVENRVIFGSSWVSDLKVLADPRFETAIKNQQCHLLIVPHNLSAESLRAQKDLLSSLLPNVPQYEISASGPLVLAQQLQERPGIVFLNKSGVLCELYTKFTFTFVGGGFERSIHSVLEPFLSGSKVVCGPKIHRSTEFDFISELAPEEIHLLKNGESFYTLWERTKERPVNQELRARLLSQSKMEMESIIDAIESC